MFIPEHGFSKCNGKQRDNVRKVDKNSLLIIGHQNLQGVKGKTLLLDLFLESEKIDIFCVTETWLKEEEISVCSFDDHNIVSASCRKQFCRGGTAILVKNGIQAKPRKDVYKLIDEKNFEISCVEIKNCVLLAVYRSPCGDFKVFLDKLELCLSILTKTKSNIQKEIILCGDFNINFNNETYQRNNLLDLLGCFTLKQNCFDVTRITSHSATCIDNIFSSVDVLSSNVVQGVQSDHFAQIIAISAVNEALPYRIIKTRRVNKDSVELLKNNLQYEFHNRNITSFNDFFTTFLMQLDAVMPIKSSHKGTKKTFNDWATKGLKVSQATMKKLYDLLAVTNNERLRTYIRRYSKIFKQCALLAKKIYIRSKILASDNVIKSTWNIIKKETGKTTVNSHHINKLTKLNNDILTSPAEIANYFNEFFAQIASELTKDLMLSEVEAVTFLRKFNSPNVTTFSLRNITPICIVKIIENFKCKSSCDLWGISTSLIKNLKYELAGPLANVINNCVNKGHFPDLLKVAKVIPLYKKGSHSNANNYRPISLLPVFSKIYEKFLVNELYEFIENHKIINKRQFGFQRKKSTAHAITTLLEKVLWDLDSSKNTYGLFCDLSKAFDCVSHQILLAKLNHYGVRNNELSVIRSYLQNRKQITECNGHRSQSSSVEMGVPQGSILGPLLFLIYINDLVTCVENETDMVLFADDTTIVISDKNKANVCGKLDNLILTINDWFKANNLILNVDKTNIMRFFLGNILSIDTVQSTIDKYALNSIKEVKFLGVNIDSKLTWNSHIENLVGKLKSAAYAIKTIRQLSDGRAARAVYHAYFHSLMTYGILAWGNASQSNRVFILQKRAIRFILQINKLESCRDRFKELNIMTLTGEYIFQNLIYAKLHIDDNKLKSDIHNHNTRNKSNVVVPKRRLAKVDKSFLCKSITFFNKLNKDTKNLEYKEFSAKIRAFLLLKSFYTVDEALADDFSM